jgi:hypothetical protein
MGGMFHKFLTILSGRAGHCLGCLSNMYGEPVKVISGYLRDGGIVGNEAECANCGERTETFRLSSAARDGAGPARHPPASPSAQR